MSSTIVTVGTRAYRVVPDLPARHQAFIIGEVLDDTDGRAMAREVAVSSYERLVFSARSNREIALVGSLGVAFLDRTIAHSVAVTLSAAGYRRVLETVTIPPFPTLPLRHDFAMRRLPFTISGRVFGLTGGLPATYEPLPGATIALSPLPAPGGELPLLLRQPLRADLGAASTIVHLATSAVGTLTAIAPATTGTSVVAVADGSAATPGDLLRVGGEHRRFYAEIAQVIAHPDRPAPAALLFLTEALAGSIPDGGAVEQLTLGAASGSTGSFVGRAFAGEAVVWLDALPDTTGGVLRIAEPGQPARYVDANAVTGPAGDYLVSGIARIATPTFEISAPGFTTRTEAYPAARIRSGPLDWYLVP